MLFPLAPALAPSTLKLASVTFATWFSAASYFAGDASTRFVHHANLLAQEAAPGEAPSGLQLFFSSPLPLFAGLAMIWYLTWFMPEKRKRQDEASMLASLAKNDRVITFGGLHGTVASVDSQSDTVVLKIDEAGTTRVKVNRSAIVAITEHAKGKNVAKTGKSGKIPGNDPNSKNASDEDSSD